MVDLFTGNPGSGALGLQLAAASRQTLSVLADYVGKVIEAQVVRTLSQPVDSEAQRQPQRGEPGRTAGNPERAGTNQATARGNAANVAAQSPAASGGLSANPGAAPSLAAASAASQFLVTLRFFDQGVERQIVVRSELAPRIGQQLTLNVLDSQRVRIDQVGLTQPLLDSSKAAAAAGNRAIAANVADNRAPGTGATAGTDLQRAGIDAALRDTLPRQLERGALLPAYRLLASPALRQTLAEVNNPAAAGRPAAAILQQWVDQLPRVQPADNALQQAQVIRTAIERSGLFYEPRLAQLAALVNQQQLRSTGTGLVSPAPGANAAALASGNANAATASPSPAGTAAAAGATTPDPAANRPPEGDALLRQRNEQASRLGDAELAARRGELTEQLRGDQKQQLLSLVRALRPSTPGGAADTTLEQNPAQPIAVVANWLGASASRVQEGGDDVVNQLLRQLLGLLGRTQSSQLVSLGTQLTTAADTQQVSQWNIEIPIWVDQKLQLVQMTLEQQSDQRRQRQQRPTTWNVRLEFDFEQWGAMLALASLRGKTMAASIWAERDSIARRVDEQLTQLRETLLEQGLQIHKLQCQTGVPDLPATPGSFNLLDTTS